MFIPDQSVLLWKHSPGLVLGSGGYGNTNANLYANFHEWEIFFEKMLKTEIPPMTNYTN